MPKIIASLYNFSCHRFSESAHWLAAGESVLNLKRLMNDLSIHDNADLRVILGMASKIDPQIIGKVLGDQSLPAVEFAQELRTV